MISSGAAPCPLPAHHLNNLRVDGLGEHPAPGCDIVQEFVERGTFDFLALDIGHRVHKVERDAALPQLPDEQLLLLRGRHIWNKPHLLINKSGIDTTPGTRGALAAGARPREAKGAGPTLG